MRCKPRALLCLLAVLTVWGLSRSARGETAPPESKLAVDTVTTLAGDRLSGKIVGIAEGKLRLTSSQYDSEIGVLVSALEHVALTGEHEDSGSDQVTLTNDDRIVGNVIAITPEAVMLESGAAGTIKFSREVVRSIGFQRSRSILLDSSFDHEQMEPWTPVRGSWSIVEGALTCHSSGSRHTLYAELNQTNAITIETKAQGMDGRHLYCDLIVFADDRESYYGRNSMLFRLYSSEYYLHRVVNGSTNTIVSRSLGRSVAGGVVRFAYDPQTRKARMWLDSVELGEYEVPNGPTTGRFVMLSTEYSSKISYIRVHRGIVPPEMGARQSDTESDVVEFGNKDRLSALSLSLADGTFVAQSSYGELRCPAERLKTIVFRKEGLEEPRRRKADVRVETGRSHLTLEFEGLDGEHLVGSAEHLGRMKVLRSAVKRIRFNIYKQVAD